MLPPHEIGGGGNLFIMLINKGKCFQQRGGTLMHFPNIVKIVNSDRV